MDAETILIAKKFSGSADVSAAKQYRDEAQAAAERLSDAADTIEGMQASIEALEDAIENIEPGSGSGSGSDSTYGKKLLEVMVPDDVTNDDSGVAWLTNSSGAVTGFIITEDEDGKTIDSYNHDHYLLTVSNVVNFITNQKTLASTVVWDVDLVNASQEEKNNRNDYMYYQIPYDTAHQLKIGVGVNAAGSAYTDLEYGSSTKSGQIMPGATITRMGRRYQKQLGTDRVKAISFALITGTLWPLTVIRLWKA